MKIRSFVESDQDAVIRLWQACGLTRPWNDPVADIRRKLQVQRELFVVGVVDGAIVASAMAGYDGHRGWVNYLGVHPEHQRKGYGEAIMRCVEQGLLALGCPKINLQMRSANQLARNFYDAIGYAEDDTICYGKRLIPDQAPDR
ncbi:MAG: GNAT family acetyltransferase [Ideonella sp.]